MKTAEGDPAAGPERTAVQRLLSPLVLLAIIAGIAALKATASVTLPLALALFLIALFWPVYHRLAGTLPSGVAAVITLTAFLVIVAATGAGLWLGADEVLDVGDQSSNKLKQLAQNAKGWAKDNGLPVPSGEGGGLRELVEKSGQLTLDFVSGFVLVIAFFVLGLLEVGSYRARMSHGLGLREPKRWIAVVERIAHDFQRYLLVRTFIGVITGVAAALTCWALGVKAPIVWGLSNFLLNYIPTLGSVIAVIPPTLFAFLQFDSLTMPAATLAAIGGMQLVMGNYIDPLLQGKYLSLSPVVVLLSVAFWGWVWGVMGALIGVPITLLMVLVCREFESTRFIAVLLARWETEDESPLSEDPPVRSDSD